MSDNSHGILSRFFKKVISKLLSSVEVDCSISNQHEFNGTVLLKEFFGMDKKEYSKVKCLYFDDEISFSDETNLTWYDSRERHPTRSEYRLYFATNDVIENAKAGDILIIAETIQNEVIFIILASDSTISNQVAWLMGLDQTQTKFTSWNPSTTEDKSLLFVKSQILENLGIPDDTIWIDENLLDLMCERFPKGFPKTRVFSEFAYSLCKDKDVDQNKPDLAILEYMNKEETLFRTYERYLVSKELEKGFGPNNNDVDKFITFSLSVHNRRKSRAGFAFENHLEFLFQSHNISYSRGKITENKSKPDFLFPSVKSYHSDDFPVELLTMLGVKTSCKDRWRQILTEAKKLKFKHLTTLETGISENQTNEMLGKKVQLVIPKPLHNTFTKTQQKQIISLETFFNLLKTRQACQKNI